MQGLLSPNMFEALPDVITCTRKLFKYMQGSDSRQYVVKVNIKKGSSMYEVPVNAGFRKSVGPHCIYCTQPYPTLQKVVSATQTRDSKRKFKTYKISTILVPWTRMGWNLGFIITTIKRLQLCLYKSQAYNVK